MHPDPTAAVLRQVDLPDLLDRLNGALGSDCAAWAPALHREADRRLARKEAELARALRVVARAAAPVLAPEHPDGPYLARAPLEERFALPGDLPEGDLDLLERTATSASPWCWQARVADYHWIARGDMRVGERAFACFVHGARSAGEGGGRALWAACTGLLRAVALAERLEDGGGARRTLAEVVGALLPRAALDSHPLLLSTLLKVGGRLGLESRDLVDAALMRGEREVGRGSFHWGRALFAHARALLASAGAEREAETLATLGATLLADEARFRRKASEPGWICAALLERAIGSLRALGDGSGLETLQRELASLRREDVPRERADGAARLLQDVACAFEQAAPEERPRLLASLPVDRFASAHSVLPARLEWDCAAGAWDVTSEAVAAPLPGPPDAPTLRLWAEGPIEELRRRWAEDPLCDGALEELVRDHPLARGAEGRALVRGLEACLSGDVRQGLALLMPVLRAASASDGLAPSFRAVLASMCRPRAGEAPPPDGGTGFRSLRAEASLAFWASVRWLVLEQPAPVDDVATLSHKSASA